VVTEKKRTRSAGESESESETDKKQHTSASRDLFDSEPEKPVIDKDTVETQVEELYKLYPRKKEPDAAKVEIRKALKRAPFETIRLGLQRYVESVRESDPKYIPYPVKWFKGGCWADVPETPIDPLERDFGPQKSWDDLTPEQERELFGPKEAA